MVPAFKGLVLLVLGSSFLVAESETGLKVPSPPQNLTARWVGDAATLTWDPPQDSMRNDGYNITKSGSTDVYYTQNQSYTITAKEEECEHGSLRFKVTTLLYNETSEPAVVELRYPDVIKNLQCYVYSSEYTNCSWDVAIRGADLQFVYRLALEDGSRSINDPVPAPQECSWYIYTDGLRTGCIVRATAAHSIRIKFSGMANGACFQTFRLWTNARPPPLKWTVEKNGNKFNISWVPPEIKYDFKGYSIHVTWCNESWPIEIKDFYNTSIELEIVPHCQYRMTIIAVDKHFSTPPEEKYFEAEKDPNALEFAAIIIPLIILVLAIVTSICFKKNKELFFPKIPIPRDLLTGILDTNKSITSKAYIPQVEPEENCDIVLVMDSQTKNPHF